MDTHDVIAELDDLSRRIAALRERLSVEEKDPEFPDWAQEKVDQRICLVCGEKIEPDERISRGCHASHARRVFRRIEKGEITEFKAIEVGLLAPKVDRTAPLPLDPRVREEGFATLDKAVANHEAKKKKTPNKKKE